MTNKSAILAAKFQQFNKKAVFSHKARQRPCLAARLAILFIVWLVFMRLIQVALAVPLRQNFSYSVPDATPYPTLGTRVQVPFGTRSLVGVVVGHEPNDPSTTTAKIKPIQACLDTSPVVDAAMMRLAHFAADYYFASLGQTLQQMLPSALRQGADPTPAPKTIWQCTLSGQSATPSDVGKAPKQQQALAKLQQGSLDLAQCKASGITPATLKALATKDLVEAQTQAWQADTRWQQGLNTQAPEFDLSAEQRHAIDHIPLTGFVVSLLDGVTGSGKTEVYLQLIDKVLRQGKQVLILVPEIGLTPQTLARFANRFDVPMQSLHSNMTDNQRLIVWHQARTGDCALVIGTRSAVFTPFLDLGLLVIDEEHDLSFKQQDGIRYHGRDLAIVRAQQAKIPVLLGSATPALETLSNATQGRYRYFRLSQRSGQAKPVTQEVVDLRQQQVQCGLSDRLLDCMQQHLANGHQVLLFLNRRGFAPALLCNSCGYAHLCEHCDVCYTVHQTNAALRCHHCGSERPLPHRCQTCQSPALQFQGLGTQQLESFLKQHFPHQSVLRIDRDSTAKKGAFEAHLDAIHAGKHQILIGTQMLAKGHHFPQVTLVALLDVDAALFQGDFRAQERLAQLYTQVAGRAGRAQHQGHVLLQTRQPENLLLQALQHQSYQAIGQQMLQERQHIGLPPHHAMLCLRAEAQQEQDAQNYLLAVAQMLQEVTLWQVIGPLPAPIARKAGRFRHYLCVHSDKRAVLQKAFAHYLPQIEALNPGRGTRLIIDRDPADFC